MGEVSSGFPGLWGDSHQPLADKPPSWKAWGMGDSAAPSVLSSSGTAVASAVRSLRRASLLAVVCGSYGQ